MKVNLRTFLHTGTKIIEPLQISQSCQEDQGSFQMFVRFISLFFGNANTFKEKYKTCVN